MLDITIVMTTWFIHKQRVEVAEKTLDSWQRNLKYDNGNIYLHIADDGSLLKWEPENIWKRSDITYSIQYRHGVGASLNRGFKKAFERSPIVLYAVDDWELLEPFDITPWVYLINRREDVGIVRLGPPHPHLFGRIEPMTELWQGWALRLDRHGLCVGHRPELFHKRYIDYYGWFVEDTNAQECERLASVKWADDPDGPSIVLALPHSWYHIDLTELPSTSHVEPQLENGDIASV